MKKQRPKSRQVATSSDKHNFGLTVPNYDSIDLKSVKKEGVTTNTSVKLTNEQLLKHYLNSS
jgi:hypothetical protein